MGVTVEIKQREEIARLPEEVIAYFGGYLINRHEDKFEGGENQIQQLCVDVLNAYNSK